MNIQYSLSRATTTSVVYDEFTGPSTVNELLTNLLPAVNDDIFEMLIVFL